MMLKGAGVSMVTHRRGGGVTMVTVRGGGLLYCPLLWDSLTSDDLTHTRYCKDTHTLFSHTQ